MGLTQVLITFVNTNSNSSHTNPNPNLTRSTYPPHNTFSPTLVSRILLIAHTRMLPNAITGPQLPGYYMNKSKKQNNNNNIK